MLRVIIVSRYCFEGKGKMKVKYFASHTCLLKGQWVLFYKYTFFNL